MLQDIRKENTNRLGYALVAAAGVGMLFIGLPPLFGAGGNNPAVATVNGHEVRLQQYNGVYRELQNNYPDLPAERLKQLAIEQTIERALFEQQALDSHYLLSDVDLYHLIKEQFGDDKTYQAWLSNHRMSAESYQNDIRRRETIINYYQIIQPKPNLDFNPLLENYLQTLTQKRSYILYTLPISLLTENISVDQGALEKYYQDHIDQYLSPETVSINYTLFNIDDLAKTIKISDEELAQAKKASEQRAGKYLIFDHPQEAEAAAKALASGEKTFADYQQEITDDKIIGQAGELELNAHGKGVLPATDDALFALEKVDDISPVIQTDYGAAIIQLTEISGSDKTDDQLRLELARKAAESQYTEIGNQAYDAAQNDKPLSAIAAITGGTVQTLDNLTDKSTSAPFLAQDAVKDQLFGAKGVAINKIALPVALSPNESLFFTVTARQPAAPRPFADIQSEVERDYRQSAAAEQLKTRAENLASALKAGDEEKITALVAEYQASSEDLANLSLLNRGTEKEQQLTQALFSVAERVQILSTLPDSDGNARVAVLTAVSAGNLDELSEQEKENILAIMQLQNNNLFSQHLGQWLYDRAKIKIHNAILQQL